MTPPLRAPSPFSPRTALGLVSLGAGLFLLVLWLVGSGLSYGPVNNGGAHGGGKGLTGYSALAQLMELQGWEVSQARSEGELRQGGLVILTPPADADGADLARIVAARRGIGPTVIVTPKWQELPLDRLGTKVPGAKEGWVTLGGVRAPEWKSFLDDVGVSAGPMRGGWRARGASGALPDPRVVLSGRGARLVPLVVGGPEGRILAAYVADGPVPSALAALALAPAPDSALDPATLPEQAGTEPYPLVVVFEPDLLDNYGFARREQALFALRLIAAAADGTPRRVTFDLSLNGFARQPNLLTLALTPPFLAATLCLLIAALIAGWRAFRRFGPPRVEAPDIAVGKAQLVRNAGAILRRSRRFHLLGAPYAALLRDRLARALALPRMADGAATEAAIDRALAARDPAALPFSHAAGTLRHARRPADLLNAAQALHKTGGAALERTPK